MLEILKPYFGYCLGMKLNDMTFSKVLADLDILYSQGEKLIGIEMGYKFHIKIVLSFFNKHKNTI